MRLKSALVVMSLSLVCLVPRVTFADTITLTDATGGSIDGSNIFPYTFTVAGPRIDFAVWNFVDLGSPNSSHRHFNNAGAFDATYQIPTQALFVDTMLPASYYSLGDLKLFPDHAWTSTWTDGRTEIFMVDPSSPRGTPEPSSLILLGTAMFIGVIVLQATIARG